MRTLAIVLLATACGAPVARNVPTPNKAAFAGAVAGAAAAVTLADPAAAAATAEAAKQSDQEPRVQKTGGDVPPDVFERMDEQQKQQQQQQR